MNASTGRLREQEAWRVVVHLAGVWLVGCLLTGVQVYAVLVALFAGVANLLTAVTAGLVLLVVAVLAGLGSTAPAQVPLLRRPRGLWAWTAGVYALGTTGAAGAALVDFRISRVQGGLGLYLVGGVCYALAAALFLPDLRVRLGALGAAAVLAAGGSYAVRAAAQPPTLDEWITANGVNRALLQVGDPPPGYTLEVVGASEDSFGAVYERLPSVPVPSVPVPSVPVPSAPVTSAPVPVAPAPSARGRAPRAEPVQLHFLVTRAGHGTRRVDARGCPVPFGEPIHCTDDGDGRRLVTYEGDHEHQELRLHRDGLVCIVTTNGIPGDPSAARHILSTLRPATDAELAPLLDLPIRR